MKRILLYVVAVLCALALRAAADPGFATAPSTAEAQPRLNRREEPSSATGAATKSSERLREGTRLNDVAGTFQNVGDRVAFLPQNNKESYRVLENLALERINQTLDEGRGQRSWVVSGTITEFRDANYLLVSKAVVQLPEAAGAAVASPDPPAAK